MRVTDTNAKGKIVFKSKSGAYIALLPEELDLAEQEIQRVRKHRAAGLPRQRADARKY
jgi:hypothetical protein